MKKLFLMVVAAMAMTACGGNAQGEGETADTLATDTVAPVEGSDSLNALIETVNQVADKVDADTKALIEKVQSGSATEEEKTTLLQKLKKIGAAVVTGDQTLEGGAEAAKAAVEGSKEEAKDLVNKATSGAVEKAEAAKAKVDETKAKVENVKNSVNQVKGALDALKK